MNESNIKTKNLFETYSWQLLWPILGFLLPYIVTYIFYCIAGYQDPLNSKIHIVTYREAIHLSVESIFALFVSFVLVLISTIVIITKKTNTDQKELMQVLIQKTKEIKNDVDHYLQKAKIVFESGINEYDVNHLLALRRILNALDMHRDTSINIYAIDNSEPRTWWSDTMTGYLALLANWKSIDTVNNRRSVFRIFVCQKNELLSPVFIKTISLHSLMGFKTYVITLDQYNKIYSEFSNENKLDLNINKEVLIWLKNDTNENGQQIETPIEVSFNLDKLEKPKIWNSVKCYQSFWGIGSDYNKRNDLINKTTIQDIPNYYKHLINSKNIDIWFEFVSKEKNNNNKSGNQQKLEYWNKLPLAYSSLIQKIISNMECCKDSNEVKQIEMVLPYGIEIKTSSCNECIKKCDNQILENGTKFDFTSTKEIQNMLQEYYNKLN